MKKILSGIMIFSLWLSCFLLPEAAFGSVVIEEIGEPIKSVKNISFVASVEDGVPVGYTTGSGYPAVFQVVQLETGEILRSFPLEYGFSFWTHAMDSQGNVYTAGYTQAHLYRYSPVTKTIEDLGSLLGETAICQMVVDEEDNLYLGTYPNAKVLKYSPFENRIIDLGNMLPGEQYVKSLAYHEGSLYGGGNIEGSKVFQYQLATGQRTEITPPLFQSDISSYYAASVAGKRLFFYCYTIGSGRIFLVYDLNNQCWIERVITSANGKFVTQEDSGYTYFTRAGQFYRYHLATDAYTNTGILCGAISGTSLISISNDDTLPGKSFPHFSGKDIILMNFETGNLKTLIDVFEPTGDVLNGILAVESQVFVSGHMGTIGTKLDMANNAGITEFPLTQATAITKIGDKIYFGVYPETGLVELDLTKDISPENPKTLFTLPEENQGRPMEIVAAGDKIAMSTIGGYGSNQGCLVIYDPIRQTYLKNKNIVDNQSICGLEYRDGYIYATTTVTGGHDSQNLAGQAKIIKYEMSSNKKILEVEPQFQSVSGVMKMSGGLAFGPDELLWGVTDGLIFALNPDNLSVEKEINIAGMNWSNQTRWLPYSVEFDQNGILYATPKDKLYEIDINSLTYKEFLSFSFGNVEKISIDQDDIYFYQPNDTKLYRLSKTKSYLITDRKSFLAIADDPYGTYQLMNDIDLGDYTPFAFSGKLYAETLTTIKLQIQKPSSDYVGLFSIIENGASVENIKLEGSVSGYSCVGGIAGLAQNITVGAKIKNCVNEAAITGNNQVGGFIGRAYGCNYLTMEGLVNKKEIRAETRQAGGICGLSGGMIKTSKNEGSVRANNTIGGLAGWVTGGSIEKSYNIGDVLGNDKAGGLIGTLQYNTVTIRDSYNAGKVSARSNVGRIAAYIVSGAVLTIQNCYLIGRMEGTGIHPLCGLIEGTLSTPTNTYYFDREGNTDDNNLALDLAAMKTAQNLLGSEFENTNNDYQFPQIVGNTNAMPFDIFPVTILATGNGSVTPTPGQYYYYMSEELTVTAEPASGHYMSKIEPIELDANHQYRTNVTNGITIALTFSPMPMKEHIEEEFSQTEAVCKLPLITAEETIQSQHGDFTVYPGETYAVVFATANQFYGWTLIDYGIKLDAIEYTAQPFIKEGKYGILFYGEKVEIGADFVIAPYAVYQDNNQIEIKVYGIETNLVLQSGIQ